MRRIPYGMANYKALIEENYYYVDKTMYLEKLENSSNALFYLRPGRFGKSLFIMMMYYYYDINSKDLFNNLFKGTYVYNNPTKEKNSYYVLKFDFSGIESENKTGDKLINAFKNRVISGLMDFNNRYNTNISIEKENNASTLLDIFIKEFESLQLDKKIYIMIDEYDNFTNAILEGDANRFKSVIENEGGIKAFYVIIKENMGKIIGRFFTTGICPITLDFIMPVFNTAKDISTDLEFNSMVGFTHEEVKKLVKEIAEEENQEKIYNLMIENYDGYLFNKRATDKVFNATLVMYLLDYYEAFKKVPNELMDPNIAFNSGKVGNLIKLQNNKFYKELLNEILLNDKIKGTLKNRFDLSLNLEKNDILSLLYYFGYLTINPDGYGDYYFKIPNQVMKELYGNYFLIELSEANLEYDNSVLNDINEELKIRKIDRISSYVGEMLEKLDNRDFIELNEKSIKLLFFAYLINNKSFNVRSEQVSNHGYIDLYLEKKNPNIKNNIIIELKYIKKKDYSRRVLNEKINEGKKQLLEYSKDERLDNPLRYLVVFVGNDLKVLEEV